MSDIHAGAVTPVTIRCAWRFDAYGQHLRCDDSTIPGEPFCADHFIEWAHQSAPFSPLWRRFPETPIPTTGAAT